ncbi:acyltransferase family protein [Caulobacter sp. SLTY]|uniref:acyltransferase family protein n=1 Tax=Caulobacter sp. SLTY TaxID=2683262 RepID=UPI001412D07A|nr:acyltransferase [Caulobacter sp. SLTY]NBB16032.1 acyltransferase family protein [Caulobacter sp. SLTY]
MIGPDETRAATPPSAPRAAAPPRLNGLDTVRFICAAIVVFAHTGQPPLREGIDTSHIAGKLLNGLLSNLWSSAAAVIAFFVISGFVIHYAYAATNRIPSVREYFARRYIRILIPAIAAILLSMTVGLSLSLFEGTILWSVVCELIYYTIYPLLLILRRRVGGWMPLVVVSFILALGVAATDPGQGEYPKYGTHLNWLLGLPCWLMGCWLADAYLKGRLNRFAGWVWPLRGAAWAGMSLCMVLRYHSPVGYPWTLNVFAIVVTLWLAAEVTHYAIHKPPVWLEWTGRWSYSLYLVHKLAAIVYVSLAIPSLGLIFGWLLKFAFILAFSYVFYLICEKPAHQFARWAGARLKPAPRPPAGEPTSA